MPETPVVPTEPQSARVRASWQRSRDYGVPAERVEPWFAGLPEQPSPFARCGGQVLDDLARVLTDEPVGLALVAADGLVLARSCDDAALAAALDSAHFAPGFRFSEHEVGTNGPGLALADRVPVIVLGEEHYAANLRTYTCAAAPVFDPFSGRLEGCVNLTTPSRASAERLLALASSAAANTAALLLAHGAVPDDRGAGPVAPPAGRLGLTAATGPELGRAWSEAVEAVAVAGSRPVVAVGEPGAGRATLLAQGLRRAHPGVRVLDASAPPAHDTETWLGAWLAELVRPGTAVVVRRAEQLPAWAAGRLREHLDLGGGAQVVVTAERFDAIPGCLASGLPVVVAVPPLRDRPGDVGPLLQHLARRRRGRELVVEPDALRALQNHPWPGNVTELEEVVSQVALRGEHLDLAHLPPRLLAGTTRRLTRIETFERDEIIRVLTRPGLSMQEAADELGMSRATLYRKLAAYDVRLPGARRRAGSSRS